MCAVGFGFTGEEIKLYDCEQEVSASTNFKSAEILETAVSGENHSHYNTKYPQNHHGCPFTHNSGIKGSRQ